MRELDVPPLISNAHNRGIQKFSLRTTASLQPILRLGTTSHFDIPFPAAILPGLPICAPGEVSVEPPAQMEGSIDSFGNRCIRFVAQAGALRSSNSTLISSQS